MKTKAAGFSLIEVVIAVAIIAVLAAIIYPTYRSSVLRSQRSDAINTLQRIKAAEEKYRSSNTSYGSLSSVWGSTSTPQNLYDLAITNISATSYTITATAKGGQANDTGCTTITLAVSNGADSYTPATCWQ